MNFEKAAGSLREQATFLQELLAKRLVDKDPDYQKAMLALGRIEGVAVMLYGVHDRTGGRD